MIVTVGILLLVAAAVALLMRRRSTTGNEHEWDSYLSRKIESTERLLRPMARSFSRSGAVARMAESQRGPDTLRRDLELGGAFNSSLHIFYSMQLAALVVSSCLMALSFLEGITALNRLVFVGIAVIVAIWPYNRIRSSARRKAQMVLNELPDFAEVDADGGTVNLSHDVLLWWSKCVWVATVGAVRVCWKVMRPTRRKRQFAFFQSRCFRFHDGPRPSF